MGKFRKLSAALAVVLGTAALPLMTATPASAVTAITGHGHVVCAMDGTVKYGPKLQPAAQATVAGFKAKLTCSVGETGSGQVTVTAGRLKGTSSPFSGSCAGLNVATMTATIKWKATGGKVTPTTIAWNGAVNSTQPYEHSFDTATITGSYSAQPSVADFVSNVGQGACAVKPLKRWPFLGNSFEILTVPPVVACGPIATTYDQTWGSNGKLWFVVAPASYPACASHPTGTLSVSIATVCGAFPFSGTLADSGSNQAELSGPHPANLWGIDTGLTPAAAQQLNDQCPPVAGSSQSYSGNSTYSGF